MRQFSKPIPLVLLIIAAFMLVMAHISHAQSWPEKTVKIINPYAPGGPSDNIVRMLAEGLSTELGQAFMVENRPGGGTVIGANAVAKSLPDGYTLLLATVAPLVVQSVINPALPYDAKRDFVMVAMFATVPNLISVHPSVGINNLAELIAFSKKYPGKLNYASAGNGTGPHLGGELFNSMTGGKLTHIPFAGAAPAVMAVLSGQVDVSFVNITPQIQHIKSGKLRPIAMGGAKRSMLFPDVPTVAESGLAGYLSESWNGLAAPQGTPKPVVDKLYKSVAKIMASAKAQDLLITLGAESTVMGPEEFTAYVRQDERQLTPIIKSLNLSNF